MGKFENLKKENKRIVSEVKQESSHFEEIAKEYERVESTYKNVNVILSDIDKKFASATKLTGVDLTFVFFATALQCVRQYFLTNFTFTENRPNDKDAAKKAKGNAKEHSNRSGTEYNPTFEEVLLNPVPFDATFGSGTFNLGLAGTTHRAKTLGHDPILGWIFGTANIATSTLTTWDFQSYHVTTGAISSGSIRDKISNHANTIKVLESLPEKSLFDGINGKKIIGASIIKEAIHLKSDVLSKKSLPLPFIASAFSPEVAVNLGDYGIDTANLMTVGKQITYSVLINLLISMIHGLFYDESSGQSKLLYQVRTRKILSYSNLIASSSNILAVAIVEAIAAATKNVSLAKKGLQYLDIGGILVTCYRLISDYKFIKQVKTEFLENEWYNAVYGEEYKFMQEIKSNE